MSELCAVHKIVAAPDGRCVLCRRPKFSFGTEAEDESVGSKTLTALLGLGLLAAMGFAAYSLTTQSATAAANGGTREDRSVTQDVDPVAAQPQASAQPSATSEPPREETAPIAEDASPQAEQAQVAEAPSKKRARPRTIGKKIVDPRLIEARKSVKVTMYSAPWCFICDRARSFLEAREVELVEYDVDMDPEAEKRLQQLNATGSIPTFIVDGKAIVGFHPWGLEDTIDAAAQEHFCMKNTQGAVCERLASAR